MRKTLVCLSLAVMALLLSSHAMATDCLPQFSISPESVSVSSGNMQRVRVTVTSTGTCDGSATAFPTLPAGWISGANFTTGKLKPGESESSTIKIIPTSSDSVTVRFMVQVTGTNAPPAEEQPSQPPVNATPAIPIKNETPAPIRQNISEPQQAQEPSGAVTGMVTSNPAIQSAVIVTLLLGGAYVFQILRGAEKKYRYKR